MQGWYGFVHVIFVDVCVIGYIIVINIVFINVIVIVIAIIVFVIAVAIIINKCSKQIYVVVIYHCYMYGCIHVLHILIQSFPECVPPP